ncbi:ABC transporter ATP-binding protein [Clostridium saccharobutylicum]|uniref:Peptide ABC transporter ATP-binding protein y4tS n=1 Tax=Clostridium saccharobutylicum DSM 13864 TaxID=1345695 RepID=U5MQM0_CLOSA|nr:ABC transporter ATP-binding protein [Clostridium saccharobutylicum]AGX43094.1 peptide ABC transporter ATP-binding protein y4tS [Clostridium saccharobutylicum DSM 13864]AQR90389.1 oligopeptide transport ATP-binding protein OppF [Clostridium saccharobutylicum]AQS00295.1 oligopeptide transport ATP-binding protein OppF [Clostridium saccharobutylicum]AQS14278.1 oligopeptide transport ATP-binding protein OppF [Clostridium saccharobutylicum]MBA2907041.1 oligopeptide/dipeptide ABC transporter ATP-b
MREEKATILKIENLTKKFNLQSGKKLTAVDNVSFELYLGECLGIVGESGCGKSTIAKILTQLESVTAGNIIYKTKDITNLKGEELRQNRRNLQMIFQDAAESFNPRMKIDDIVSEPLLNFKLMKKREAETEGKKLLTMVGISEEFMKRYPHQLSGGQKQRVAIARALSVQPEIIVCDEATSALDVSIQDQVIKLLMNLQKEKGMSYIFIGHDLAVVRNISHRIIVMYLGRIVEVIDSDKLVTDAAHPYTKALLNSVFSVKMKNKTEIESISGEPPSPSDIQPGCAFSSRCTKCTDKCLKEKPELKEIEANHFIACHLFKE